MPLSLPACAQPPVGISARHLLLVTSSADRGRDVCAALRQGHVPVHLDVAEISTETVARLRRGQLPRPALILLEMEPAGPEGGLHLLEALKADPAVRRIPVVVLAGTDDPALVWRCYAAHANCYVTRPDAPGDLAAVLDTLATFWFEVAVLPE